MDTITKEAGVVRLATKDKVIEGSLISRAIDDKLAIANCLTLEDKNAEKDEHENNYLYFTSDERLIHPNKGWTIVEGQLQENCIGGKLVIATADPKLLPKHDHDHNKYPNQIPQSFIESYAKNPVDEVLLEYERATYDDWMDNGASPVPDKLKLVNNEVVIVDQERGIAIIKTPGDAGAGRPKTYTRDEVAMLIHRTAEHVLIYSETDLEEWIKDNI
tara:strand:+ start:1830 stop:2480 length:651 start_codon:yes stop_codon:yes gene_type:complete